MENQVNINSILTKNSTENEIKSYFLKILELKKSNKEFPVDLDGVWTLVYTTKGNAIRELIKNFIQDVDYQIFIQKDKNLKAGRPTTIYKLSVSCLEYFIARKVRAVFDVYRNVFHKAIEQKPMSTLDLMAHSIKLLQEQERKNNEFDNRILQLEAKTTTRPETFTIAGYATLQKIKMPLKLASSLGRKASKLCKDLGITPDEIPDPRFGIVKSYPVKILEEIFENSLV